MKTTLPLLPYTLPTSEMVERAKMAIQRTASPVFNYSNRTEFDPVKAINAIELHRKHIEQDDSHEAIKELELRKLDEQIVKCHLITAIQQGDDLAVTKLSTQLYGECEQTEEYFSDLLKDLFHRSPLPALKNDISTEEAEAAFRTAMDQAGLQEWQIIKEDRVSVAIRKGSTAKPGTLRLPQQFKTSEYRLNQLIAHEINVHAKRFESGRKSNLDLLSSGTAGYIETEEGLALYLQEKSAPSRYLPPGFWQAYAISIAKNHSFYDTYQKLFNARKTFYEWIGRSDATQRAEASALRLCLRTFSGITKTADTSAVFMKGILYFNAFKKVSTYLDPLTPQQREKAINQLLVGKIGLDDLSILNRLPKELNPLI